jgi:hypothetical protein
VKRAPRKAFRMPFCLGVTRKTGEAKEEQRDAKETAKKSDGATGEGRERNSERRRRKTVLSDAKQPLLLRRRIRLEQQANELLEDLARFIGIGAEELLNIVLRTMMANDADSRNS